MQHFPILLPRFAHSLIAAALVCAVTTVSAQEVKFSAWKPRVGDVTESTSKMDMNAIMKIAMGGQEVGAQKIERKETETKTETFLAVKDNLVTKLRAQFGDCKSEDGMPDGGTRVKTSPLSGKTFIVEKQGDKFVFTDEKGGALEEVVAAALAKEYKNFGETNPMVKWLTSKSFKIGDKVEAPKEVMAHMMKDEKLGDSRFSFVIKEVRDIGGVQCAVLDATLILAGEPEPGMKLAMDVSGEMFVALAHAEPISVKLTGPLTIGGELDQEGMKFQLDGTGKTTLEFISKLPK
jgi:hypothetical protein